MPVGSFREGFDRVALGASAADVEAALGRPNRICVSPAVDHVAAPPGADPAAFRARLAGATAERWIYMERPPPDDPPRIDDPRCVPEPTATELGFDAAGRLRWRVRETLQTEPEIDPALAGGP